MPWGPFLHVAGPRGDRAGVAGRGVRVSRGRRGSVRVRVWRLVFQGVLPDGGGGAIYCGAIRGARVAELADALDSGSSG
jgi:hypothetical protein